MLQIDKLNESVISIYQNGKTFTTHATYHATLENRLVHIIPVYRGGRSFFCDISELTVNGDPVTVDDVLEKLKFIGNFNPGGGSSSKTWIGTRAEFDALEAPLGSGLYPSLEGYIVIITDQYPDNAVIMREALDETTVESVSVTNNVPYIMPYDGYFKWRVTTTVVAQSIAITINGITRERFVTPVTGTSLDWIEQVSKGDSITCTVETGSTSFSCWTYKAKYSAVANPIISVEIGTDYSTEEKPVMIKDIVTGEIRQKLDVDGSPIWERTFVGTITSAANTGLNTSVGGAPIKNYVFVGGSWCTNSANPLSIAAIPYSITTYQAGVGTYSGGTPLLYTLSAYARTDAPYRLTIQYTKL
jgi:hypothetical protein